MCICIWIYMLNVDVCGCCRVCIRKGYMYKYNNRNFSSLFCRSIWMNVYMRSYMWLQESFANDCRIKFMANLGHALHIYIHIYRYIYIRSTSYTIYVGRPIVWRLLCFQYASGFRWIYPNTLKYNKMDSHGCLSPSPTTNWPFDIT